VLSRSLRTCRVGRVYFAKERNKKGESLKDDGNAINKIAIVAVNLD